MDKNLLNNILSFFKVIDEYSDITIIKNIGKNEKGETVLGIGNLHEDSTIDFTMPTIFNNPEVIRNLSLSDKKLLKAIYTVDGDLFIKAKIFSSPTMFEISSLVSTEKFILTAKQIIKNKSIMHRLNKSYFSTELKLDANA